MMNMVLHLTCSSCESHNTTLGSENMRKGTTPSGNPYIQHAYRCKECNMVSFLNIVDTPEGIQIA